MKKPDDNILEIQKQWLSNLRTQYLSAVRRMAVSEKGGVEYRRNGGGTMSTCKECGIKIDWIRTKDRRYMPVEPEPVFIIEGNGFGRYVTDEGEVITGRRALLSEQNTLCEAAFVPHWKNCPETRRFRRR